jgi:cysteine synthase A
MVDWNRRARIAESILDTAGMTPMVRLRRVVGDVKPTIVAKIEYFNPSGSVKDRILPFLVSEAERRGDLRPGMTIIEGTTGNTGIAASCVGAAKGYPVVIVMPDGMSDERKKTIRAYGSELVLTPCAESDVDLVIEKVRELKATSPGKYWEVGQFVNTDNIEAHYRTTGPEIWEQTDGKIGALVLAQGTGGTVTGAAKYLKEQNPKIKVFAVEPDECDILSGGYWGPHKIEGIGDGFIPEVLHLEYLDGIVTTTSDEAIEMARRLACEEGIFCGISSGCNVAAVIKVAHRYPDIGMIVTVLSDNGLRYFSTELCGVPTELEVPDREHPISDEDKAKLASVKIEVIR